MMGNKRTNYQRTYDDAHCKRTNFKFNIVTDADILDKFSRVPSIQGYVKALIRADLAREKEALAPKQTIYTVDNCNFIPAHHIMDIISSAVCGGINYWGEIDNSLPEWKEPVPECSFEPCISDTFDWHFFNVMCEHGVVIEDNENFDRFTLTMDKLLHGIYLAIKEGYWDGNMDSVDSVVSDNILQLALFNEIVYG